MARTEVACYANFPHLKWKTSLQKMCLIFNASCPLPSLNKTHISQLCIDHGPRAISTCAADNSGHLTDCPTRADLRRRVFWRDYPTLREALGDRARLVELLRRLGRLKAGGGGGLKGPPPPPPYDLSNGRKYYIYIYVHFSQDQCPPPAYIP